LLLSLSLIIALPTLPTPAGGGAEVYAKGSLAEGDTVKNVLVYVRDKDGNDVLLSRLKVADMVEYLNDHMDEIGKVHNYSILDRYVASVHQEAQGFTVPQLLGYAASKSPVESAASWGLGFSGSDSVSFWEIDGSGFDALDTYTYDKLYGVKRYNFPAMFANFTPGSLSNHSYINKDAVWASRVEEQAVLSVTAFSERYFLMEQRPDPPVGHNAENYFDDRNMLDTAKTMRIMLPLTQEEFLADATTASDSRYGITYIRFATSSAPQIASAGVVAKPTWEVIDGDEDDSDNYDAGYAYFTFSCATTGASILYNDTSVGSYMPTALYEGQQLKVRKNGSAATVKVRAVKEGWADMGVISASSAGGGDDEYREYVSPGASVWDGASYDTSWYDGHEDESEYQIGTAAQLAGLAALTNRSNDPVGFAGKTIRLTRDIHLDGRPWTPIADDRGVKQSNAGSGLNTAYLNYFSGTFDAGGHTISGISFRDRRYDGEAMGLFGYPNEGSLIENLTLSGRYVAHPGVSYLGSAAGRQLGGRIENVTNLMNLTADDPAGAGGVGNTCYIGGIAGSAAGKVTGCANRGTLTSRNSYRNASLPNNPGAGGIVGTSGTSAVVVANCTNYGTVRGDGNLGGICNVGSPTESENRGYILAENFNGGKSPAIGGIAASGNPNGCTNYSDISATGMAFDVAGISANGIPVGCSNYGRMEAGGAAAGISAGSATGCRNFGSVTASGAAAGISAGGGTATDCVNAGAVSGKTASGIAVGGNIDACVNYGKITGVAAAGGISAGANSISSTHNVGIITATGGSAAKSGGLVADIGGGSVEKSYDMTGQSLFGAAGSAARFANVYHRSGSAQNVMAAGIAAKTPAQMKLPDVVKLELGAYSDGQGASSAGKFTWR
jgi:hypothetical protein